jgi:hypothetical protein
MQFAFLFCLCRQIYPLCLHLFNDIWFPQFIHTNATLLIVTENLLQSILNPLKPKLVQIAFKNSVCTSKRTLQFTITRINWIIQINSAHATAFWNTLLIYISSVWQLRIYYWKMIPKAKAVPLYDIKVLGGERWYSSYSYSTSALDGSEWSALRPGRALAPGKGPPVPIVQEAKWAPEPVLTKRL